MHEEKEKELKATIKELSSKTNIEAQEISKSNQFLKSKITTL